MKFDSAGFKTEVRFLTMGSRTIQLILSSPGADALFVYMGTDSHYASKVVKKTIGGEDRYYNPDDDGGYYVINRKAGFVDFYDHDSLSMQMAIED